jgi:uncharacterized protein YndB with AHSA1/START domain
MNAVALAHRLDRTLVVYAPRATVFEFFVDSARWASWWGAGSTIDARPGGRMLIRHPNGVEASGEVLEVDAPERIVFTYGYSTGPASPPGSTRVTIRLDRHPRGTLLQLTHEFSDITARDEHIQGWRFQFALFANLIANAVNTEVTTLVDQWFAAWGDSDGARREGALTAVATSDIRFGDKFSWTDGIDDLKGHLVAAQRFMPGMRLERRGDVRHCLWHVLADWIAVSAEGQPRGRGTNLFVLDADGRITEVIGFWAA